MFEKLRRLVRRLTSESAPDSFDIDCPRPQRSNPDPPKRDWYARTQSRSFEALSAQDAATLKTRDKKALSVDDTRAVDDLVAQAIALPVTKGASNSPTSE